jgi:hypothetical protein
MESSVGFPRGPFGVSSKFLFRRWLAIALCVPASLAIFVVYFYLAWGQTSAIWHDQRVWNAGGPEGPVEVSGDVTTRQFVLKSYRLKVAYVTPDSVRHQHQLELETLFGGIDEEAEQTVRLAPDNPDDFALSGAVAATSRRYFAALFFLIVGGAIAVAVAFLAWAALRQLRRVRVAAEHGVLRLAPLVRREPVIVNGRDSGAEKVVFRVDRPDGGQLDVDWQLRTKGSQLLLGHGGRAVLAVVPAAEPALSVLMLESFYPLTFSPADAQQLRQALAAAHTPSA